ncbi:GH12 family glycosyl hydrolase domain-containing protein [Streptomyces sp. HMX112]|uniref:GH12 family glycosyl hydrolase domain-containing protein n=1 Tax=Streptomyces sp. HMX112 TaxID=3390850 RepID=UPI003A7F8126
MERTPPHRHALAPLLALLAVVGLWASPAHAAVWYSSDRWGTWSSGGHTLYNNVWGSGTGPQTIWADSATHWGVWADHPGTGGIKSYPNVTKAVDRRISALTTLTSHYDVSVPAAGAYSTAYDIWDSAHRHEIMLWVNHHGPVGPLGSAQGRVTLGGHTWDVYRGDNGSNAVYSFLRTADSTTGRIDLKAVLDWLRNSRKWIGDIVVGDVQFGYEITSSPGGLDFVTRDIGVSAG